VVVFLCFAAVYLSVRTTAPGSVTFHPAGIPHGPHPGRYEASIGERRTEELAVMLDCEKPLVPTAQARNIEDAGYEASFSASS